MIVEGEHIARFVSKGLDFNPCPPYTTMGIERNGYVVGGLIFSNFEGSDVQITACGKGWTKGFMEQVGSYVYDKLGCCRITFVTEQPAVVEYAKRLGGKVEGVMRDHYGPDRDGTIIGVLRREWKYDRLMR